MQRLEETMTKLRLSGARQTLEVRLQEALGNNLSHQEFLELLFQDELAVRKQRAIQRRIKKAEFRDLKSLEDFDFSFNTTIKRSEIYELAAGHFIREARDLLFLGPPGVGKSHLAQGLGHNAIRMGFTVYYRSIFDLVRDFFKEEQGIETEKVLAKYLRPQLLIIDDMGIKQLPNRAGEHLFEVIMRRHEKQSTIMTTNRPIEEWGKLINDVPAATAILDRFLQTATMIAISGRSYRLRNHAVQEEKLENNNEEAKC
jgi:DNA replication protein DnaC